MIELLYRHPHHIRIGNPIDPHHDLAHGLFLAWVDLVAHIAQIDFVFAGRCLQVDTKEAVAQWR